METLLSVQSVPTGSVHWLPVTYEQYCTLIKGNKDEEEEDKNNNHFYPNKFFRVENS